MKVGDTLPDVEIDLDTGERLALAKLGKPLVLFFYPKAFSPVCTAEACHFRDLSGDLTGAGAIVLGVAPDDAATLNRFKEQHKLPYPSISDPDKSLARRFDAVGALNMMKRLTVVADADGKVVFLYSNVLNPNAHSVKALEALRALS